MMKATYIFHLSIIFLSVSLYPMNSVQFLTEEVLGDAILGKKNIGASELYQVNVPDQFEVEGCSRANCGLHALRNGMCLAFAAQSPDKANYYLNECLGSDDHARSKLGVEGKWTKTVKSKRGGIGADWLTSKELKVSIEFVKEKEGFKIPIAVFAGEQIAMLNQSISVNEALEDIAESAKYQFKGHGYFPDLYYRFHNKRNDEFVGVVLIYVPLETTFFEKLASFLGDTINDWYSCITRGDIHVPYPDTRGQWISLVIISKNGETQYVVADSASNLSRLNDPKVASVIDFLEGTYYTSETMQLVNALSDMPEDTSEYKELKEVLKAAQKKELLSAYINRFKKLSKAKTRRRKSQYDRSSTLLCGLVALCGIYLAYRYKKCSKSLSPQTVPPVVVTQSG